MQLYKTLADRYRLIELIGAGGAAEVYKAEDLRLGREVAVKVLRPQFVGDEEQRIRFQNEARTAAALTHPNVVDVYDYGQSGDTVFMVMQYIAGQSLKEYIQQRRRLYPIEAARVALAVCKGLEAAHERGLVHRDVKPQNIMIDRAGQVRITDFGIAKALGGVRLTQAGMTYGTAAYLSPEQAGGGQVGPTADLYSLGLVLYEMLAGVAAFDGDNAAAVAYKQVYEQPTPLRELAPDAPPQLEAIINRAIAKDPAARYPTAGAMAAALSNYLAYAPAPTPPHMIGVAATGLGPRAEAASATAYGPPALPGATAPPRAVQQPLGVPAAPTQGMTPNLAATPGRDRRLLMLPLLVGALAVLALGGFALGQAINRNNPGTGPGDFTPTPVLGIVLPTDTAIAPTATAVVILGGGEEQATSTTAPAPTDAVPFEATNTPVPEPPVAPTDTAVPEPPTDTPVPHRPATRTPAPPTPTTGLLAPTQPPTAGGSRGRPVFPTPTIPTGTDGHVRLEDVAFTGGYRYQPPSIYPPNTSSGHTAVWIYGAGTEFGTMQAQFNIAGSPAGEGTLLVSGLDSEGAGKTTIRIQIDGRTIFEGADPLPDYPNWGTHSFTFDAAMLQPDRHTISFANLDPSNKVGLPPFLMLDYVDISWQTEQ